MEQPAGATPPDRPGTQDAGRPAHSGDGVDLTLIRWMLSLSPLERLQTLQNTIDSLRTLRDAPTSR